MVVESDGTCASSRNGQWYRGQLQLLLSCVVAPPRWMFGNSRRCTHRKLGAGWCRQDGERSQQVSAPGCSTAESCCAARRTRLQTSSGKGSYERVTSLKFVGAGKGSIDKDHAVSACMVSLLEQLRVMLKSMACNHVQEELSHTAGSGDGSWPIRRCLWCSDMCNNSASCRRPVCTKA